MNIFKKISKETSPLFLLIFAFACALYMFKLNFSDLWSDEIYTKSMLSGSLPEFFARFKNDLHPPLYYLGLKVFTALFGSGAIAIRLFSVLGVLSTLLLGYFAGQRIFGKTGALYFCIILMSVPMLAAYSHQARMYTWAAFSVTGVFIYAYLFMKTGNRRDLILLAIFTLTALYLHYFSMAAAFVANAFVFLYLLLTKSKKIIHHLLSLALVTILFLPWVFIFAVQIKRVQHAYWAPEVSLNTILSCFTTPFSEQFWASGYSVALTILVYSLIVITLILSFKKSFATYRLALWLSVSVFLGTMVVVSIISLISQPILFARYIMTIVTMLAIAPTILIIKTEVKWLKLCLTSILIILGVRISVSYYGFSYGPYRQTIEYISSTYPAIKKILHISEITAGPLVEYTGNSGLSHYWLKAEMSNVDAFTEIHQYENPNAFLQQGEEYCAVRFQNLDLNIENLNRVMQESELIKTDTVNDRKMYNGIMIQLYILKYTGPM